MRVLLSDDDFGVCDKPSGVAVHRGWTAEGPFAVDLARTAFARDVFPVHRLDRGTSGVLLVAFSSEIARVLHEAFEDGRVEKRYLALVRGVPPESGVVDHPIPRREDGPRVPAVTAFRRLAISHDIPREGAGGGCYSLVEAIPKTGRLHQVRRHLKHLSHPIIGDANYGKGPHNRLLRERFGLARLALHAASVRFQHPRRAEEVLVTAPLPEDLSLPFHRLGIMAMDDAA